MNGEPQALLDGYKDLVKGWVPKVRDVLDKDFTAELKRLGIPATGKATPIEKMNLPDEDRRVRTRVEALLRHDSISEGSDQKGYENVRRELSYTCLNRLVGLKCMEARKLLYLPPPGDAGAAPELTEVITNIPGQARSRYLRDLRATGGSRYKYGDNAEETLLREGLTAAYRFITSEIQVLFDPDHEYACLWPTHGCLTRVIAMINDDLPEAVYRAQDFLGWVYQFFNREEKKKVRDENKGTPRSSYELSVINQFYTPSWVVKALVDNTLGRLWLQMHPDSALRPSAPPPLPTDGNGHQPVADYIVPNTGEEIHYDRLTDEGRVETYKRAADISLLDPACGAMHFGQYAFGLFHQMYLDEIRHAGEPGWPAEPSIRDPEAIPAAIVERNLFGIDIDARAIQIASLSLLLTAKEAAVREGHSPLKVRLRRSNLVVANAVDIGEDQLRALVGHLEERLGSRSLQEALFKTIWENLRQVGELGSLIQVQESVTRVLDEWVDRQAHQRGITRVRAPKDTGQLFLESVVAEVELDQRKQMELERRLLEEEAAQIRRDLLSGLEEIARSETDPAQRLFAEDTARGLKLLELLSKRYDVVVMNPPYGSATPSTDQLIDRMYNLGRNDIYCAFVDRGLKLVLDHGYLGALTSRSFFSGPRFFDFRTALLGRPYSLIWLADLGAGILDDATVSTAAYVVSRAKVDSPITIFNLDVKDKEREDTLARLLRSECADRSFRRASEFFLGIADHRLSYNMLGSLSFAFHSFRPMFPEYLNDPACVGRTDFSPSRVAIIQGIIPVPLEWFARQVWEISSSEGERWRPLAKGGDYGRFWYGEDLVIDWADSGRAVRRQAKERYGSESRTIKNTKYFGRVGLTFPRVSSIGFSCRWMPQNAAFTDKGQLIIAESSIDLSSLLGVLNSELVMTVLRLLNPSRFTEVNDLALVPLPNEIPARVGRIAHAITDRKRDWANGLEPNLSLTCPHLLWVDGTLPQRLASLAALELAWDTEIRCLFAELNDVVESLYRVSSEDRATIRSICSDLPVESVWPGFAGRSDEQKRKEHVWRLLSFAVKRVVEADEDGVVPLLPVSGEAPLLDRVRAELAKVFPSRDVNEVEVEIVNELKRKVKGYDRVDSLQEWLESQYFAYHASMYKSRPICWHVSSRQGKNRAAFSALVHYHRFNKDRMAKLRGVYLREALTAFRREAALAGQEGRTEDRLEWQAKVEEAEELDRRLQKIQEGFHQGAEDYRILTPWKSEAARPKGWDPDINDGVKVNIEPLQRAGVLRIAEVL